jgi:hypothetical protein
MTEAHIEIAERRSLKMVELRSGDVMVFIYCIDKNNKHHELINLTIPKDQRTILAQYIRL